MLALAGMINILMVMLAAATFHEQGLVHVSGIEQADRTLAPILGGASSAIFAVALLASGLSASAVLGVFRNRARVSVLVWGLVCLIASLNVFLLARVFAL